jgi:hypothetical protein
VRAVRNEQQIAHDEVASHFTGHSTRDGPIHLAARTQVEGKFQVSSPSQLPSAISLPREVRSYFTGAIFHFFRDEIVTKIFEKSGSLPDDRILKFE